MSYLPKYRVMYYDYIVKWCSGEKKCNLCVSLDISKMLALNILYNLYKIRRKNTTCTAVYHIEIYVAKLNVIGDIFDLNLHISGR